ncbi:MAG TPA: DUF1993 domain-containing protein [Bdellovibrionales bacterium]|nr:DUF1993 domain-containing protein [Bdellovibrionales bacterium]
MIYDTVNAQFVKMLQNLTKILDKAAAYSETKKFDAEVLLRSRLFPDQFELTRQIQIVCDTAKLASSRLAAKEAPVHADNEKSIPELKTRIESVISYLNTFRPEDYAGAEQRRITQTRWQGKTMSGHEYVNQHAIPNFYFHLTTAYAILRHNGVEIGKGDYLGPLPLV